MVLVLVGGVGFPLLAVVNRSSNSGTLNWAIMIFLAVMFIITVLLFATMQTTVTREGVTVSFGLIRLIRFGIPAESIQSAYARTYAPVAEYGGWGIKGRKKNRALNMRGTEGVQLLLLENGTERKLLIGSARASELAQIIQSLRPEIRSTSA